MKNIFLLLVLSIGINVFGQNDSLVDPNINTVNLKSFKTGDTILNLNALNNGIISFQLPKESKSVMTENGLDTLKGGIIVLVADSLIKKNFGFEIKTFASDNEWYINTIRIKVVDNNIQLIHVTSDKIEMATGFRKEGKIFVVIGVSMILFFVIISYLIALERKTKRLEKQLKK